MPINPQLLERLKKNDPTLIKLEFHQPKITDSDMPSLCDCLTQNTVVTQIDLSGNQIGDVEALAMTLEQNSTLTRIDLRFNKIGVVGAQALAKALEKNRTLTTLGLMSNEIGDVGAQALARALEQNRTLTTLELDGNEIGATGAQALAKALEQNCTLTTIDLQNNEIGDVGAQALARALEQNRTLTTIKLNGAEIGAAGAQALAMALEQNHTLTLIELVSNKIGTAGAQAIARALEQNRTLTRFFLWDNQIDSVLEKTINDLVAKNRDRAEELFVAVKANNLIAVKLLLNEGVSVTYYSQNKNTALHIAAERGYVDIVSLFLRAGAVKGLCNKEEKTALQLARENHHQAIVDLLDENEQLIDVVTETTSSANKVAELTLEVQAEELFNQGYADYKAASYETALKIFDAAIQLIPHQENYFYYRCKIKLELKQLISALEDISQAILLKPKRAMYYAQRAAIKVALKNYQSAIEDYDQAIRYKSSKAHYFYERGKAKEVLKQYAEALTDYEQALKLNEDYAEANEALVAVKALLKPFHTSAETTIATFSHAASSLSSEMRSVKEKADGFYAEAKTYFGRNNAEQAEIAFRAARDSYKELQNLGVDCQKRLDKIKARLKQLTATAPLPIVPIATPPSLQGNDSINKDIAQASNPPIAAPKKIIPPTANVKAGFFKQPIATSFSTTQASSSQTSSVHGSSSLLQAQPGDRNTINTAQPQLRR